MHPALPILAGVLAAGVAAQSPLYVSPAAAALALGTGNQPLFEPGSSTVALQQVHDPETFSRAVPGAWNRMWLRPAYVAPLLVELEVTMAFASRRSLAADTTFTNNMDPITTAVVVPRQLLNLPTAGGWSVALPFARSFPFPGTLPVAWVLRATQRSVPAAYGFDAWSVQGTGAQNGAYGGCHSLHIHNAPPPAPGSRALYRLVFLGPPSSAPAVLLVGRAPMVFDLGPFGAPGCLLLNLPELALPALQDGFWCHVEFAPPPDARLAQATYWVQFALAEPSLNPLGLGTSEGLMQTLATPLGITTIRSNDAQATAGTLRHNLGIAVGFD